MYEGDELQYILFEDGVIKKIGDNIIFEYHLKDHLGNTRVAFDVMDYGNDVVQISDYYPFGKRHSPVNPEDDNKYLYNSKELQDDILYYRPLDCYDYGARFYDPQLGRWHSVDPACDLYYDCSPYQYVRDNPISLIDPNGMWDDGYGDEFGNYIWFEDHHEDEFTDINGTTWTWITDNKEDWMEAIIIRDANIEALTDSDLEFDEEDVKEDVRLYEGDNPLFTKFSRLKNSDEYISEWEPAYNSETRTEEAKVSGEIGNTGLELKFYPTKGEQHDADALGLVKASWVSHAIEAFLESIDKGIANNPIKDPIYDMHLYNAIEFLKKH